MLYPTELRRLRSIVPKHQRSKRLANREDQSALTQIAGAPGPIRKGKGRISLEVRRTPGQTFPVLGHADAKIGVVAAVVVNALDAVMADGIEAVAQGDRLPSGHSTASPARS